LGVNVVLLEDQQIELDTYLGVFPDCEVAELFGVSIHMVGCRRRALGIPCKRKKRSDHGQREYFDWGCEAVANRIGRDSDSVIAKELGCSRQAVHLYRQKHGIPSWSKTRASEFDWSIVDWRYSDRSILALFCRGCGIGSLEPIRAKRLELGFPYDPKKVPRPYKGARGRGSLTAGFAEREGRLLELIGTKPDYEIARELGFSVQLVGDYRRECGVAIFGDKKGRVSRTIDWVGKWDRLLKSKRGHRMTHREIAKKIGCSQAAVSNRCRRLGLQRSPNHSPHDWEVADVLLRKGCGVPEVSRRCGIPMKSVYAYRLRHRIFVGPSREKWDWSKIERLLGTMSDRELGLKFGGIPENTIGNRRRKLGIPAWKHGVGNDVE